eukprot:3217647-Prymnesium_polylepis.2
MKEALPEVFSFTHFSASPGLDLANEAFNDLDATSITSPTFDSERRLTAIDPTSSSIESAGDGPAASPPSLDPQVAPASMLSETSSIAAKAIAVSLAVNGGIVSIAAVISVRWPPQASYEKLPKSGWTGGGGDTGGGGGDGSQQLLVSSCTASIAVTTADMLSKLPPLSASFPSSSLCAAVISSQLAASSSSGAW